MANEEHVDIDDLHNEEEVITSKNEDEEEDDLKDTDLEDDNDVNENSDFEENSDETVLTGTEKFLAQYGIIGGMIEFEDGTSKHYENLDQDEQFNVLKSIAEGVKTPIEAEYDLDNEEIELLNFIREQKKPVNEVLQDIFADQLAKIEAFKNIANEDYVNMTSESVYLKWLQESDPEATAEELQENLDAAKRLRTFEKTAESLRRNFIQEQEREISIEEWRIANEQAKELETDRETIVNTVEGIRSIAGWEISDEQKNEILGDLLEVNSQGDSLFMERIFSNPQKLFEVAWMEKFADKNFNVMAEHYKNEISEAYKRGKNDGMKGLPGGPIRVGDNKTSSKTTPAVANREKLNAVDIDDLYRDE
jgi:hypothetical protein